jgi:hypothetical protein
MWTSAIHSCVPPVGVGQKSPTSADFDYGKAAPTYVSGRRGTRGRVPRTIFGPFKLPWLKGAFLLDSSGTGPITLQSTPNRLVEKGGGTAVVHGRCGYLPYTVVYRQLE